MNKQKKYNFILICFIFVLTSGVIIYKNSDRIISDAKYKNAAETGEMIGNNQLLESDRTISNAQQKIDSETEEMSEKIREITGNDGAIVRFSKEDNLLQIYVHCSISLEIIDELIFSADKWINEKNIRCRIYIDEWRIDSPEIKDDGVILWNYDPKDKNASELNLGIDHMTINFFPNWWYDYDGKTEIESITFLNLSCWDYEVQNFETDTMSFLKRMPNLKTVNIAIHKSDEIESIEGEIINAEQGYIDIFNEKIMRFLPSDCIVNYEKDNKL